MASVDLVAPPTGCWFVAALLVSPAVTELSVWALLFNVTCDWSAKDCSLVVLASSGWSLALSVSACATACPPP